MDTIAVLANVALPRGMESADLVAVTDQLQARADAVTAPTPRGQHRDPRVPHVTHLPSGITVSLGRLKRVQGELRQVNQARDVPAAATTQSASTDKANAQSDEAWRAFEGWLAGWTRLEDGRTPSVAKLRALYARVFPTDVGLRFVGWRPRKQWEAMKARMEVLGERAVRDLVTEFGGARFLAWLAETHAAFGTAYHFTAAGPADQPEVDTRPQWMAAQDALRDYVRKVAAYADPEVEGSEALAEYLLGPFNQMTAEFARRAVHAAGAGKPAEGGEKPAEG